MNLRDVLTARALQAWAGTDRLSALAYRLPGGPHPTRAAKLFALFVGGETVDIEHPLVERVEGGVRARSSVLPLGRSLLVCDRLDTTRGLDEVSWPDDSSYHLALAIPPGRRRAWLDIATGNGFAPLHRPELAESILGTDLNAHAIDLARTGAALSDLRATFQVADLADGVTGTYDLVTCNAPIPAHVGPLWRATADPTLFTRLLDAVPRLLAPDGLFVLHAALEHVSELVAALPGETVTLRYVPHGGRPFGIVWWRPHRPSRHIVTYRPLTPDQPHVTYADHRAALESDGA